MSVSRGKYYPPKALVGLPKKYFNLRRKGGFFEKLCTIENIELADSNARKSKKRSARYIAMHDAHKKEDNEKLLESFKNHTYKTSPYVKFRIYEPKERVIYKLPYYPDRIAQHAIMNVVKAYWTNLFISNTYSCIEGRGIHKCLHDVRRDLIKTKDTGETKYCLKLDIVKFYPSIQHTILKEILRRKIKDKDFLQILDEIIDSVNSCVDTKGVGVPIGNYLSQFYANIYLTDFDHWVKEVLKCRYYYRYADDIVILGNSKEELRVVLEKIQEYLWTKLRLKVKENYQIFPVPIKGIDFVGYVIRPTHTLLRKSIKNKITLSAERYHLGLVTEESYRKAMASYYGWMKYANTKHLLSVLEQKTGIKYSRFLGREAKISWFKGKDVNIIDVDIHNKYYIINFVFRKQGYSVKSTNKKQLEEIKSKPNNYLL